MRRRPQLHLLAALAALSIAAGAAAAPRDGGPPQHLMQLEQELAARPLAARGAGWGDPHYIAFSGQKFSVCVKKAGLECQVCGGAGGRQTLGAHASSCAAPASSCLPPACGL